MVFILFNSMRLQVHPREESVELVSEAHHIQRVSSFVCI